MQFKGLGRTTVTHTVLWKKLSTSCNLHFTLCFTHLAYMQILKSSRAAFARSSVLEFL